MSRSKIASVFGAGMLAWSAMGAPGRLPPAPNANMKPKMLQDITIVQKLNGQIPLELTFKDEAGQTVRLGQYFQNKPVILALVYYQCPMLCNMTLNGLVHSLQKIQLSAGDDFQLVAVSINPRETPQIAMAKKENYLEKYQRSNARNGWHFLTGKDPEIKALADAVGFQYAYDPLAKQYAHAAGIMVATPEGRLSRYYYGIEYPNRDLRLGLVEASHNKIGSPVDQVLLFCYHYDPVTGKYGLMITRLLQVLGSATAVALFAFVFLNVRREGRPV